VDISGGETYNVPVGPGGPLRSENDEFQVGWTGLLPPTGGLIFNSYFITEKKGRAPLRILVEDVSGDTPVVVVDDRHPRLEKDKGGVPRFWKRIIPLGKTSDPANQWLSDDDETVKVYRYTVTAADGTTTSLLQAAIYPPPMKDLFRKVLGMDASDHAEQAAPPSE
jgi:hypothetical protein